MRGTLHNMKGEIGIRWGVLLSIMNLVQSFQIQNAA